VKELVVNCDASSLDDTSCVFAGSGHCRLTGSETRYKLEPPVDCPLRKGKVVVRLDRKFKRKLM
jgi:hypothetical protein